MRPPQRHACSPPDARPLGAAAFYSNEEDPTLPAVRVEETPFPNAQPPNLNPYLRAQLRWPAAIRHALGASRAVRARWTMIVDDDTFVMPQNVRTPAAASSRPTLAPAES